MNRTKSAFLGVVSSQVFMVISILLNLFSTPFLLKNLNPEIYGLSIIIFQLTSYLGMFDFGLGAGVSRFLAGSRGDDDKTKKLIQKIISTSFIVYAIMGTIVALAGNLLAPFASLVFNIPDNFKNQVFSIISIISILVGLQFLLRAISGVFFAHQKLVLSNSLSFVMNISNTILTVLFVYLKFELWSFVYAQIIVFVINSLLNLYFFRRYYGYIKVSFKNFDFVLLRQIFSYGFSLFIIGIAVQVVFQTDRLLIGSYISLTAVSIYSLTTRFPELISQLIWKISDNSFPGMVELSKGESSVPFTIAHNKIMHITLSISSVAFWIILLVSYPFLKLWVGEQYYAGIWFITIVSYLYLVQLTFIHVTSVCINGAGIARQISVMSVIEAVVNLALSIFLCKKYGISGVIIATIVAGIITTGWYIPYLGIKYMKSSAIKYLISILKPILSTSSFGAIIYLMFGEFFRNITSWLSLFGWTLIVCLLFFIPLILINKQVFLSLKTKVMSLTLK